MVCICQDDIKGENDQSKSFLLCCKTKCCCFLFNSAPSSFLFWLSASFQQMVFLKGKCYLRGRLYTVGRYLSFYFFQLCLKKKLPLFPYMHTENTLELLCKTVQIEFKQVPTNA